MRTLNDIVPPSRRKAAKPQSKAEDRELPPQFPYITFMVIGAVIVVSLGALFYFSSAAVEVTPNTVSVAVQSAFTAGTTSAELPFKIVTAQKIASQSVKGSGTKIVNSTASGNITIYNTQPHSQPLLTKTRFATTAGLVFRIHSAVTVPGGSVNKPGSLSVQVFADQPGSPYNVAATSFTIPGFAGTPLASKVYARSTSTMTGGASGNVPVVEATLEAQTRTALITALSALTPDGLLASIQSKVPPGYMLLDGDATTTYEVLASATSATAGMVDVKEQGTITAVLFPNAALAKAIAASATGLGYQGEPLTLAPSSKLVLIPASDATDPAATSYSFSLTGTASLIYTVDPNRIAVAVSGKSRAAAQMALTNYPEVKSATIILRPFWRQTFPQDPATIKVVVAAGAY